MHHGRPSESWLDGHSWPGFLERFVQMASAYHALDEFAGPPIIAARFPNATVKYACRYASGFPQRAFAPFRAISLRCSGVSFSARALPPFSPPALANSFTGGASTSASTSPVATSTMNLASWLVSRGRLGRVMPLIWHAPPRTARVQQTG